MSGVELAVAFFVSNIGFFLWGRATAQAAYKSKLSLATHKAEMRGFMKPHLKKLGDLNKSQSALLSSLDAPSASASHSRYKNEIVEKIKALEAEKMTIYREILDQGMDPTVSVYNKGEEEVIKLSEAVSRYNSSNPPKTPTKKQVHLAVVKQDD